MKWLVVLKVDFPFERIVNGACRNGNGYLSDNHSLSGHLSHLTPSLPKPQRLGMMALQVSAPLFVTLGGSAYHPARHSGGHPAHGLLPATLLCPRLSIHHFTPRCLRVRL